MDGYGSDFFKKKWDLVGHDVCAAVNHFFETCSLSQHLHHTLLVLLPKVENPSSASEFWPIACCPMLYKCITKFLCLSLGEVLPHIVNQNQGAFVKNRLIVHNILLGQKLLKGYNKTKLSLQCVMKIDMKKAYDSIS